MINLKHSITLSSVFALFIYVADVNAANYIVTGNDTWSGSQVFSDNGTSIQGISANGTQGTITADDNINSNRNEVGISVLNGGELIINNTSNGKLLDVSDNTFGWNTFGINAGDGSLVEINNMSVNASGNGQNGIAAFTGSVININGAADGSNNLRANDNVSMNGIESNGNTPASTYINIKNMNINANGNGGNGISADFGQVLIEGIAGGSQKLTANNNSRIGIYTSGSWYGIVGGLDVKNMDIEVIGNQTSGLRVWGGSFFNAESSIRLICRAFYVYGEDLSLTLKALQIRRIVLLLRTIKIPQVLEQE